MIDALKRHNGYLRYMQAGGLAGVVFFLLYNVVKPQSDAQQKYMDTLTEQIPKQTIILEDILNESEKSVGIQGQVIDQLEQRCKEHDLQNEDHRKMYEALGTSIENQKKIFIPLSENILKTHKAILSDLEAAELERERIETLIKEEK